VWCVWVGRGRCGSFYANCWNVGTGCGSCRELINKQIGETGPQLPCLCGLVVASTIRSIPADASKQTQFRKICLERLNKSIGLERLKKSIWDNLVTKCHKGAEKWHLVLLMLIFFPLQVPAQLAINSLHRRSQQLPLPACLLLASSSSS
jgi:hypothetical protein